MSTSTIAFLRVTGRTPLKHCHHPFGTIDRLCSTLRICRPLHRQIHVGAKVERKGRLGKVVEGKDRIMSLDQEYLQDFSLNDASPLHIVTAQPSSSVEKEDTHGSQETSSSSASASASASTSSDPLSLLIEEALSTPIEPTLNPASNTLYSTSPSQSSPSPLHHDVLSQSPPTIPVTSASTSTSTSASVLGPHVPSLTPLPRARIAPISSDSSSTSTPSLFRAPPPHSRARKRTRGITSSSSSSFPLFRAQHPGPAHAVSAINRDVYLANAVGIGAAHLPHSPPEVDERERESGFSWGTGAEQMEMRAAEGKGKGKERVRMSDEPDYLGLHRLDLNGRSAGNGIGPPKGSGKQASSSHSRPNLSMDSDFAIDAVDEGTEEQTGAGKGGMMPKWMHGPSARGWGARMSSLDLTRSGLKANTSTLSASTTKPWDQRISNGTQRRNSEMHSDDAPGHKHDPRTHKPLSTSASTLDTPPRHELQRTISALLAAQRQMEAEAEATETESGGHQRSSSGRFDPIARTKTFTSYPFGLPRPSLPTLPTLPNLPKVDMSNLPSMPNMQSVRNFGSTATPENWRAWFENSASIDGRQARKASTLESTDRKSQHHKGKKKKRQDALLADEDKADTLEQQKETIEKKYDTPKNPIVFCHGLLGFDYLGPASLPPLQISHWRGIREVLEQNGSEVLVTRVPATSSIKARAEMLMATIEEKFPGRNINLIGHSMGGLDGRYLISVLKPTKFKILSLTTVSTPHRGSPLADYVIDNIIGRDKLPFWINLLDSLKLPNGGDGAAFEALSTRMMENFNDECPDDPDVNYYSWGAYFNPGVMDTFYWSHGIIYEREGPNDGLVSVYSSRHGEYRGTLVGVSHTDLVGWVNQIRYTLSAWVGQEIAFKPATFYLEVADFLAKKGF